ncbi:MAG: response regulator [Fibrobacterota bacterium]
MTEKPKILIVDDEEIMRNMLKAELEDRYSVTLASNAGEALSCIEKEDFSLAISDINMPGMKGYELLAIIREKAPETRTALITAYDVNDYIRMAGKCGTSNIIPKTTPFNFDEFNSLINGLITGNIFGIEKYMKNDMEVNYTYTLKGSDDIETIENEIIVKVRKMYETSNKEKKCNHLLVLLEEALTNAIYHAPADESGREKYRKHSKVVLLEEEYIDVILARDSEKYGVSVIDKSGRLRKDTVLYKIDRHISGEGLLDESGRGLHMSRIYSDRLIINIAPGKKTEVILLNYFEKKYHGYKPLYINEL